MNIGDHQTIEKNGVLLNLSDIEKDCWQELMKGCMQTRHPFHQPAFASSNNCSPEIRTVVLRKVVPTQKQLYFHTDCRSRKYNEIKNFPQVSCLFYDFNARLQIRVNAIASLHCDDGDADEAWKMTGLNSRKTYMIAQAPSTISHIPTSGLEEKFISKDPSQEESEAGRKNFCLIKCLVKSIDWLWLNSKGHKRAVFTYENTDLADANWIIP